MTVYVKGITELDRTFRDLSKLTEAALRVELATFAEPVRAGAERLALSQISGMERQKTTRWQDMRTGVGKKGGIVVYVVPKSHPGRGHRTPRWARPNLAGLLMDKAMQPALDENEGHIANDVDHLVDRLVQWNT